MKTKDFLLGVGAGAAIALGGILNLICKTYLTGDLAIAAKILGSFLFPVGLITVCFLGLNLYTGKIGFLLDKKPGYPLFLVNIFIGNIVGAAFVGFLCLLCSSGPHGQAFLNSAIAVTNSKSDAVTTVGGAFKTLGFACLCGILVYLAVYFFKLFKNQVLKCIGIIIPIALFVYFGFDHCIANAFYFSFGVGAKNPWCLLNIALAVIGNSIGAIVFHELKKLIVKTIQKKREA